VARADRDHRQIVGCVGADQPGREPAAVGQRHPHRARALHDVRVGDDVTLGIKRDARPETAVGLDLHHLRLGRLDDRDVLRLQRRS
jgi:hypothetical protein